MKKVLFTLYKNRSHSLYKQFIDNPPEGYQYFTLDDFFNEFIFKTSSNFFLEIVAKIKRNKRIIKIAQKNNINIIYCSDGILLFNSPIPWIMDLEHVTGLVSNYYKLWKFGKKIIPLVLGQRNLKYIIPWTKEGANVLKKNFEFSREIRKKIKPIYLCLKNIDDYDYIEKEKLGIKNNKFSLLFVTSINYNRENEFYAKGGWILIKTFEKLKKQIDIRLILRSKIPLEFDYLKRDSAVEIYEEALPYEKFQKLFLDADIFFYPGYQSPGMAFLDAMNYNLPIISTDVFANKEMVQEGQNGFLVNFPSSSIAFYLSRQFDIQGVPSGIRAREDKISEKMINAFVEKIIILYKNRGLREKMGANSKKILLRDFSLSGRNIELKNIFDKIITKQKL